MPVGFDSNIERKEGLYEALPEEITVRPEMNGRQQKPDIEWLIADILKNGQIENVGVWKDGKTAVLAYGFSRWRAVSEINARGLSPKPLKLKITLIKCDEQGAFIRNISENRMRNDVSAIDDAYNLNRLMEVWQFTEDEVVKIYFPTAATEQEIKEGVKWVRDRLKLVGLSAEARKAFRAGRLDETAAQAIAKLSSAQQRDALKKKEGKITKKDITGDEPAKKAKKPKIVRIDPELRRRVTAVTQSANFDDYDASVHKFMEVDATALVALKNFFEEK